jgi:hypothetical protein
MRREAVLVMQVEVAISQRRACGLMEMDQGTCRYRRRKDGRGTTANPLARASGSTTTVRLSAVAGVAAARRLAGEPQAGLPAVCGREAGTATQAGAETFRSVPVELIDGIQPSDARQMTVIVVEEWHESMFVHVNHSRRCLFGRDVLRAFSVAIVFNSKNRLTHLRHITDDSGACPFLSTEHICKIG